MCVEIDADVQMLLMVAMVDMVMKHLAFQVLKALSLAMKYSHVCTIHYVKPCRKFFVALLLEFCEEDLMKLQNEN